MIYKKFKNFYKYDKYVYLIVILYLFIALLSKPFYEVNSGYFLISFYLLHYGVSYFAMTLLREMIDKKYKYTYFILTTLLYIFMFPNYFLMLPLILFIFATKEDWKYLYIFLFIFMIIYPICLDVFIGMKVLP